jgi:hypothetical protein
VCLKRWSLFRIIGGPFRIPPPPQLLQIRVGEGLPFTVTGIDYLGHLKVKIGKKLGETKKFWVCLFTCAVVRSVHLELVQNKTTHEFLLALRRFVALYGSPSVIVSDNASELCAGDRALRKMWRLIEQSEDVQAYSLAKCIKWQYIPEKSPWMGGFYERMVGTVKVCLKKALDGLCLYPDELRTVLAEVTEVVNSRPLVYAENVPGLQPLTPGHFLRGGNRQSFPDAGLIDDEAIANVNSTSNVLLNKWKRLQNVVSNFWEMWRHSYLKSLRERPTSSVQRNTRNVFPAYDTVVQVKDPKLPRAQWRLGRVEKLIRSADGEVRVVVLKLWNGRSITRPIRLLYPLETGRINGDTNHDAQDTQ